MSTGNNDRSENALRILVIEDERKLAGAIAEGLEGNGYAVAVADSGETGIRQLRNSAFDLVLLDVMLPRQGGLETLREMRRSGFRTPVLILTSRGSVDDRVRGLDAGADDYLVKPFAVAELLARVQALLRRGSGNVLLRLKVQDLSIDLVTRKVERAGRRLDLTAREFDLLEYLMRHAQATVSREMLAHEIWKDVGRATPLDNVIDVHIARLRRKVDGPNLARLIHTVRGVGFCLGETESE